MIIDVDKYISQFPEDVQQVLESVRQTIKSVIPEAEEVISYQMPTFKLKGKSLIYFAAWKQHLGLYPTPAGIEAFADELSKYKNAKGSVQFPLNEEIPLDLIKRITQYQVDHSNFK